jgi:predicted transcriptional regulator
VPNCHYLGERSYIGNRKYELSRLSDTLNAMADEKALHLLDTLSAKEYESEAIVFRLNISRKAYYLRMARLVKLGIVRRRRGKYSLTIFGKILHELQTIIDILVNNYWKLKALDELETTTGIPMDERKKIIDSLIDNETIRGMFFALISREQNKTIDG